MRPYGQLPHDLAADPRLSPTDVRVAMALLYWARHKAVCWPSDASIGRRVGRSVGTVQRSLRRLQAVSWIHREKTSANRTGRLIRLAWRDESARPSPSPALDPPAAPARDERDRVVKGEERKGSGEPARQRSRPDPTPPSPPDPKAPGREAVLREWAVGDDPILRAEALRRLAPRPSPSAPEPATVAELLARIRESPGNVARAAELLAQDLDDRKSWRGLHTVCRKAWEGVIPPAALVSAWREATAGKARNPGALFMAVVKRESR